MQKNKFEKQVQQKMEEFNLQPSGSVWSNIEAHISKKKRPKSVWLFVPITIGLLGLGLWLMNSNNTSPLSQKTELSKNATNKNLTADSLLTKIVEKNSAIAKAEEDNTQKYSPSNPDERTSVRYKARSDNKLMPASDIGNTTAQLAPKKTEDVTMPEKEIVSPIEPKENTDLISNQEEEIGKESRQENDFNAGIKNISSDSNTSAKKDLPISESKIVESLIPISGRSKSTWRWGINLSLGISGVPTKFLGSLDKSYAEADKIYSTMPATSPGGGTTNNNIPVYPSKIRPSAATSMGLFAEKNISKKVIIALGLNYKIFSATNKVGSQNINLQMYSLANPVNDYHNYYRFVELPVSLKVQLASKKMPLLWDGGVSLSQLVSSNALQFNTVYAGYEKNNSLFNKSQLGFNSGFSVGLFSAKASSLLIGPHIYYGTTKVAEEGLYKNQHFTFIELRSQLLFKK